MTRNEPSPNRSQGDRDAMRVLADAGNQQALDRLADLAEARGDSAELNQLLDEGSEVAGEHLAAHAVAAHDLVELQRLADEGVESAENALERLLDSPTRRG